MAWLIPVQGRNPQIPAFLAPNATLVGDVRFGPDCSVWFGAVLRGDINHIALGPRCNIQDLCCLHVSRQRPCELGADVSVGHGAIVHACQVGDGTLIGLGARILDGAVIGKRCLIAAGCVVPEGLTVPDDHLVAGVPGRIVKPLSAELAVRVGRIAGDYVAYQQLYPQLLCTAAQRADDAGVH